jgi:predicted Zn-dependent peptidase
VPLASLTLLLPRGAATDPPGKAGATALMADMLDEGAGGLDAIALGDAFQRLGTDYEASAGTDAVTLGIHFLADQFEPSLALLSSVALRPDFSAAEMERRKSQRVASLLAGEADPANSRAVVLRRSLFGEGYGGYPADGIRETLSKVTLDDVKAQYKRLFTPKGAALIVVGALDPDAVRAQVERHFGPWQGGELATNTPLSPAPAPRGIYLIDHPGATQSAIAVASRAPGADAPDLFESHYYNWAIGGAFMSRVNLKLREEKGYTYGARAGGVSWRVGGAITGGADVRNEVTGAAMTEYIKEYRRLGTEPVPEAELAMNKRYMAGSYLVSTQLQGAVGRQLASNWLVGLPADFLGKFVPALQKVTAAEVQAIGKKYFNPDEQSWVVVGDPAKIADQLKAFGEFTTVKP